MMPTASMGLNACACMSWLWIAEYVLRFELVWFPKYLIPRWFGLLILLSKYSCSRPDRHLFTAAASATQTRPRGCSCGRSRCRSTISGVGITTVVIMHNNHMRGILVIGGERRWLVGGRRIQKRLKNKRPQSRHIRSHLPLQQMRPQSRPPTTERQHTANIGCD